MQPELIVLNGIVFSALALGVAIRLRRRTRRPEEADEVYRRLALILSKRFPELPPGFTIREGLELAKPTTHGVNWALLKDELGSYETFRFGGGSEPAVSDGETLKLLRALGAG
jgi:hypothetical protein